MVSNSDTDDTEVFHADQQAAGNAADGLRILARIIARAVLHSQSPAVGQPSENRAKERAGNSSRRKASVARQSPGKTE